MTEVWACSLLLGRWLCPSLARIREPRLPSFSERNPPLSPLLSGLDSATHHRGEYSSEDLHSASPVAKPLAMSLRSPDCSGFNVRTLGPTSGIGLPVPIRMYVKVKCASSTCVWAGRM